MIQTRTELKKYIAADAAANGRSTKRAKPFGDEIWKFILTLRKLDYYKSQRGIKRLLTLPLRGFYRIRYHRLSLLLNFTIPVDAFGKGLAIVHYGTIVVSRHAKIGENCRIHEGVTIGATNGSERAAQIGNNVFLASGAKIIGDITVANDVAIAANAVVTASITEPGTTWGGVPAGKISDKSSRANLCDALFR